MPRYSPPTAPIASQYSPPTVEVGERPGAKSGLLESGVMLEAGAGREVNLCILRGEAWVWRRGRADMVWIPDTSLLRCRAVIRH